MNGIQSENYEGKKRGIASDEEWENIEDLDDDIDETRFVRFNDEIEEFNN